MNNTDIENLSKTNFGLKTEAARAKLATMQDGSYCRHRSWGFGQIKRYDAAAQRLIIDFPDAGKLEHPMAPEFCIKNLEVFPAKHIFATQQKDPEAFAVRLKSDPISIVKEILKAVEPDKEGCQRLSAIELEELLAHLVGADKFKKWWANVRKQLQQDEEVSVPDKKEGYFVIREEQVTPEKVILEQYHQNRNPLRKIQLAERLFRSLLSELDDVSADDAGAGRPKPVKKKKPAEVRQHRSIVLIENDLRTIFDELTVVLRSSSAIIEDAARPAAERGLLRPGEPAKRRITHPNPSEDDDANTAAEMAALLHGIWVRNDLCRHLNADVDSLAPTSKSLIIAAEANRLLSGVAAKIPQTSENLRRILDLVTRVFPDSGKWREVCIGLLRDSTGKFTGECVNFLVERDCADLVGRNLLEWLNTQALKSDVLHWIVKNRGKKEYAAIVQPLLNHRLLAAILYAVDSEALQAASSRRIPLAEELVNDRALIGDLLANAGDEIARDLAKTLVINQGFEPLTKKSLGARFIRIYPSVQDLFDEKPKSQEKRESEEVVGELVVSQKSLDARRAELKEILEVKIPKNLEAIARAKEHGDLSENSEYKMAREEQTTLNGFKTRLIKEISSGRVTDFSDARSDVVGIGSVVEVITSAGKPEKYTILGAWDGDTDKKIVSYMAPLAQQLLGKKPGDSVQTEVDGNIETWTVKTIARWVDVK